MWLYYRPLKQCFFSSIFCRFLLLMLTMYIKIIFLVVFIWFVWLLSKCKNSFFLLLLRFTLLTLDLSSETAIRSVLLKKVVLWNFAIFIGKHHCWSLFLIKIDSNTGVFFANIAKFLRKPILKNICKLLLLWVAIICLRKQHLIFLLLFVRFAWLLFMNKKISLISLICLIYLSLPNLYFYTIRSITMFLKVLNKVNFRVLTQT